MSITQFEDKAFYADIDLLQVAAGEIGTRNARPRINLGEGSFKTIYDVDGVWGIDRLSIVTRTVDGQAVIDSIRVFYDGVRLATFTAFDVRVADVKRDGLTALFSGDDRITGNKWANNLRGHDGNDTLRGNWDEDTLNGDAGRDWLNGLAGDDTLYGGDGADLVVGGNENDLLFGGAGIDRLSGGTGQDTMTGGAWRDTFAFHAGDGRQDVITDFNPRLDKIEVKSGATAFERVSVVVDGDDVLVSFDNVQVRLLGLGDQAGQIEVTDFIFA